MRGILLIVFLSLHFFGFTQTELKSGVQYEGNTVLTIPGLGISFKIPAGWSGGVPEGAEVMVLVDAANEATIIISANEMDEKDVFGELQKQLPIDDGISISPIGLVKKDGRRWWGNYKVNGVPQEMKGYVEVRLGDFDIGSGCIVLALPAAFDRGKQAATELLQSMKFTAPVQTAQHTEATTNTGVNQPWNEYLKRKSLKYYYTQGDFSESDFIYLCSDGSFSRKTRTYSGGITGYGAMNNSYYGRWQATGQGSSGSITLFNQDGSRTEFQLEYGKGKKGTGIYLNGNRFFEEVTNECN